MKMNKALAAFVATSLVGTPVIAQAATVEVAREGTPVEGENIKGGWFIPLLATIAVILGILTLLGGDDDLPTSP